MGSHLIHLGDVAVRVHIELEKEGLALLLRSGHLLQGSRVGIGVGIRVRLGLVE